MVNNALYCLLNNLLSGAPTAIFPHFCPLRSLLTTPKEMSFRLY